MSELQRGIQTIYNMEQNIYLMQNVLNDLDGQISRLGKQEHFSEPEKERFMPILIIISEKVQEQVF